MEQGDLVIVRDRNGKEGTIESPLIPEDSESQILVKLEDGQELMVPASLLVPKEDGPYEFQADFYDFSPGGNTERVEQEEAAPITIPVVEEELQVGKRKRTTGKVRVSKRVRTHEEVVDLPLTEEKLEIRKVPVNRIVSGPVPVRYEGDTVILPVLKEVLVVEKRLVLSEEWHIRTKRTESHKPKRVKLRREEVVVEREGSKE